MLRSADKAPNVGVKATELFLNGAKSFGVLDRADNLEPITDNAGIAKKTFDSCRGEARYSRRIKIGKCIAIGLALFENRLPAETSLRTLECQKLEKNPVVVDGHTPFGIVIRDHQRRLSPATAREAMDLQISIRFGGAWHRWEG